MNAEKLYKKPLGRYILLGFLCLFALVVLIIAPMLMTSIMDYQNQEMLKEISTKNAESIGYKFQEQASFVVSVANSIPESVRTNPKAAVNSVNDIPTNIAYKRLGVALLDGSCYTSDGKSTTLPHTEHLKECAEKGILTVRRMSTEESIDGDTMFIMHYPLYADGQINSVLFFSFTVEEIKHNFVSDSFGNTEFFYVVDSEGNNIISTHSVKKYQDIENVFKAVPMDEKYQGSRIVDIKEDMKNGESGVLMSSQGSQFYLYYAPLNFNGWYLFSVVPASSVNASRNMILSILVIICFFLIVLFSTLIYIIVSAERKKQADLDKILYTDSLTGGASYAKFCVDVKKQLVKGKKAAYIVMDLDNFKLINDYYSYEQGNITIRFIHSIWQSLLKENEFVGRIAADRFAVYMLCNNENELRVRLEDFCNKCSVQDDSEMSEYILTPSIGVYLIEEKNTNIQQMQNSAVMAKSLVKGDSDTLISIYNESLKKELTQRKIFADELIHAIENRELSVVFQPQFSTETGKLCGAETLIRWIKPDGTSVSPAEFVPLAEERGLVKDLDLIAFENACKKQVEMNKMGLNAIEISVNVSQQSLYDSKFIEKYLKVIEETGADIKHLQLEITESTLFENNKTFIKILRKLHKSGFKILMDDFGTGYSSLMLLKSMPIDYLKLDKSFIDDYTNPRARSIIESIITMAKQLGMTLIAEGIETEEQYDYVKNQGCHIVQGYYLSRPISFDDLCDMISDKAED